jgi:2-dehydro-3-deoxygalactonokinase
MAGGTALIGIDWGTTSFRAVRLDVSGSVLERRAGPYGILNVHGGDFAGTFALQLGDWLREGPAPVIMSGMIGSRQGWLEAPYVSCPAGLMDLAAGLTEVPFDGADIRIVPGLATASAEMRDVMRGEEAQVFGALARSGASGGRFLLPGTHSKWVVAEDGRIRDFATYMTGEAYAALRGHTILGRLMPQEDGNSGGEEVGEAFAHGVREGARAGSPGALLHRLFGVRTAGLFGEIAAENLAAYLSGLLIGAEFADAGAGGALQIVGAPDLAGRYRRAAETLGVEATIVDGDCVVDFYMAVARAAGLVPATDGQGR